MIENIISKKVVYREDGTFDIIPPDIAVIRMAWGAASR